MKTPGNWVFFTGTVLIAAGCGKESSKEFLPFMVRENQEVRAISKEEADQICAFKECETNHIVEAYFGRKKTSAPVAPQPIYTPPADDPGSLPEPPIVQPAEARDYSKALLGVPNAWTITQGSPNVIVAVVDSGVDYTHPDLIDNIWFNAAEKNGAAGVDDDGNGYIDDVYGWDFYRNQPNGMDYNGHGTHCSGIIAASKNNIGTVGVAPKVKIMPLRFLGPDGSGDTAGAIQAIAYARRMGAKVVSNSWGGGGYNQFLKDEGDDAMAAGLIMVAAAGNATSNNDVKPSYPANYPGFVSVGSSDSRDQMSYFSNYGSNTVTIFAPGSSIYSTYLNGNYKVMDGTSMAAPQVSGAIALAVSLQSSLNSTTIVQKLCATSNNVLTNISICGRMNVGALVQSM